MSVCVALVRFPRFIVITHAYNRDFNFKEVRFIIKVKNIKINDDMITAIDPYECQM